MRTAGRSRSGLGNASARPLSAVIGSLVLAALMLPTVATLLSAPTLARAGAEADSSARRAIPNLPGPQGSGLMQSPIDLPPAPPEDREHQIAIDYEQSAEHLIHREHTIELAYDPGSAIEFDGRRYSLVQLHFHTPSEHLVAHQRFPVELHLVHHSADERILVVGVLFEVGPPSAFIERILADAPRDVGRVDLERQLDVGAIFPENKHFYTYRGSLTTAPFREGVQWLVLSEHPTVSTEQVVRLLVLEGGNARPVQPRHGRPIEGS